MYRVEQQNPAPIQMLYTGIFADERVLQLLTILQQLSDQCFGKLHEVVNEDHPSSTEYAQRFRRGLDSIEFWKQDVKFEETKQALEQYPELSSLYKYTIVRYLKELFKNERTDRIPVNIPPIQDFIHAYYVALSKTSYMQKLEFLNVYGLERTHMHMEALRQILMEFTRHSVYKTPTSSYILGDSIKPSPQPGSSIKGLVSVERDATHWDSVSQQGRDKDEIIPEAHSRSPTPVRKPSGRQESIYDKATQNYYSKPSSKVQPKQTQPVYGSTPPQTQNEAHIDQPEQPDHPDPNPDNWNKHKPQGEIEVVKEECASPEISEESEDADDDDKFSTPPKFPTASKVSRTSRPSRTSHTSRSSRSSSHTIHLDEPVGAPPKFGSNQPTFF